jgi:Pectate lyase superfamily protein
MSHRFQVKSRSRKARSRIEQLEDRRLFAVLPATTAVVNVQTFGATPNDNIDDTAAIQSAMNTAGNNGSKVIYFPDGIYDVSDSLLLSNAVGSQVKRTTVEGQSRSGAIVRLAANSFTDAANPKPVFDFNRGATVAQAFFNFMRDLTVEIGANNPGAIGVNFYSNNGGAIRNVSLLSTSGNGTMGLNFLFTENGPFSVVNVQVDGFQIGIATSDHINSQTLTDVTLNNQSVYGIQNGQPTGGRQALAIRNLTTTGPATGYYARFEDPDPNSVLINANFNGTGAASSVYAYNTGGPSYVRGLTTSGYLASHQMKWDTNTITGSGNASNIEVSSYGSGSTSATAGFSMLFPTTASGLNIAVPNAPVVPWGNPASSAWLAPSSNPTGDDTAVIQAAIDTAGVSTVYLPQGTWQIDGTLIIRGDVRRLIGVGGTLTGSGTVRVDNATGDQPVIIERLFTAANVRLSLQHNARRTLIVRDGGFESYSNTAQGTGDLFLDGYVGEQLAVTNQRAYIQQLNLEAWVNDRRGIGAFIRNDGGLVSILGFKTENRATNAGTFIHTLNGAQTELLGGLNYFNSGTWAATTPAYKVTDASFGWASLKSYDPGSTSNSPTIRFQDTKAGVTNNLNASTERRSYYISRSAAATPAAPSSLAATATSATQVNLNWTDSATTEIGYLVQRATNSAFTTGLTSFNALANATSYSDTSASTSTTYFYRVIAVGAVANSAASNTATVTTPSLAIAYESFESYAANATLNAGAGGTGWSSNFTSVTGLTAASAALSYTGGAVAVSGGARTANLVNVSNNSAIRRSFPAQTGTVYFSFLFRSTATQAEPNDFLQFALNDATGVASSASIGDVNTSTVSLGARLGSDSNGGPVNTNWTGTFTPGTTYFLVGKISKQASSTYNQSELFVNPTTAVEPTASAVGTSDTTMSSISWFNLRTANLSATDTSGSLTIADQYQFDELRIGASWSSVVPTGSGMRVAPRTTVNTNNNTSGPSKMPIGNEFSKAFSSATLIQLAGSSIQRDRELLGLATTVGDSLT